MLIRNIDELHTHATWHIFFRGDLGARPDHSCFDRYVKVRPTNRHIDDFMQLKGRQTADEGPVRTYVVCNTFNSTFYGLNGYRPTDFGSKILAPFLFNTCTLFSETISQKILRLTVLGGFRKV